MLKRLSQRLQSIRQTDEHPDFAAFAHDTDKALAECTCGHAWRHHEHDHKGTDCSICACAQFKPSGRKRPLPM